MNQRTDIVVCTVTGLAGTESLVCGAEPHLESPSAFEAAVRVKQKGVIRGLAGPVISLRVSSGIQFRLVSVYAKFSITEQDGDELYAV